MGDMMSNPLNATDAARMKSTGQMGPGMTVGDWLGTMGISMETPIQEAVQKIKQAAQGASPLGKMQQMAGGGAPPQGPQAPPSEPEPPGLAGLMRS